MKKKNSRRKKRYKVNVFPNIVIIILNITLKERVFNIIYVYNFSSVLIGILYY